MNQLPQPENSGHDASPDVSKATISRRHFIAGASTAITLAAGGGTLRAWAQNPEEPAFVKPRVAYVRSDFVIRYSRVHPSVLSDMIEATLKSATKQETAKQAWKSILKEDDVIGLKFNQSAANDLDITQPVAEGLVRSLIDAGFKAEQIVLIEAPDGLQSKYETQPAKTGWQTHDTDFVSGSDRLAEVLNQVTAIINVPFLKAHRIAYMTCCLKNLSHAMVMHPARFHENHCSPFIADIYKLQEIRKKVKLHFVNSLRVIHAGGPDASGSQISDTGVLLGGVDPVAVDTVGLDLLNQARELHNLPPIARQSEEMPYIEAAFERDLGCPLYNMIDIDYQQV